MEQLRNRWQHIQRELQQGGEVRDFSGRVVRTSPPRPQTLYRGSPFPGFTDREGQDAKVVEPEARAAEDTPPAPPAGSPIRRNLPRLLASRDALRRAVILSEIIGPPLALRWPDDR